MNRKFFLTLLILATNPITCTFAEEPAPIKSEIEKNEIVELEMPLKDQIQKNQEEQVSDNETDEFSIFDSLVDTDENIDHPFKIEEESLWGKIYKMNVERTSIPTYLLQDELTFKMKKGPVSKVQFYGAYHGNFASMFTNGDYDTSYDVNWANIGAVGTFKDNKTDFKIQLNLMPSSGRSYLQGLVTDAYIVNNRIPHHKIIVGNSRNQVGVDGGASSYTQPFLLRSQIGRTFGNTRALGVRVLGNYSLIDYNLALNSSDRFFRDFFPGVEFTGWVNIKPLGKTDGKYGKLTIGSGLNAGHNHTDYTVGGAYIGYSYKKFMANAEFSIADGYNGTYLSDKKASGFYTTIGYKVTPKVQVLARFDRFDPDRNIANNYRTEYTAGINYFIKGQALRLILNYIFCQNDNAPNSHRIIFGTQILL